MNRSNEFALNQPVKASQFFLGKNHRGHWVVQDQAHRRGGLFVDRVAALRYAMDEAGNRPQAVIMVPGVLELDLIGAPSSDFDPEDSSRGAVDLDAERSCIAQDLV